MESLSENVIRASMNSVDIWRGIEKLEAQGWNEQAIADALALPVRTVKRLKLLAQSASAHPGCDGAWRHAERGPDPHHRGGQHRGTGAGLEEAQAAQERADELVCRRQRALQAANSVLRREVR